MKKYILLNLEGVKALSKMEQKSVFGGFVIETCNAYDACGTGCVERSATPGGWEYRCTYCCIA